MLYARHFFNFLKAKIQGVRLDKLHVNTFKRIGEDLRKAGTLAGAGLVGIVVPNDAIGVKEGVILFIFGVTLWVFGHVSAYVADKAEKKQKEEGS